MHDILVAAFVSVVLVLFAAIFTGYDIEREEEEDDR